MVVPLGWMLDDRRDAEPRLFRPREDHTAPKLRPRRQKRSHSDDTGQLELASIDAGADRFDASIGGLGGCPYAPGATGNICSEDAIHMLHAMGYDTGIDLDRLLMLARALPDVVGHDVPGQVAKAGKINEFSGRILEIEGLPDLKVEQAFELSDASAERSAAGCTVHLNKEPIIEYLNSNITLLKWMIAQGYQDARSLQRRIKAMEAWLADPQLLQPDADAEYAAVIEIDLADITEPIVCCPNDPDDAKTLSDVAGTKIDEAFIGSCMTNIGHFRAAAKLLGGQRDIPVKLWVAPPTKMDQSELIKEGHYAAFGTAGARTEMPGCSLCMGNQAQVREGATVISTSTRNFPNRLGTNTNVFLGSAELAAIASRLGLDTWHKFQAYLLKGNIDQELREWMVRYRHVDGFDGASEHREVYKT